MTQRKPTVGIDCRLGGVRHAGIGRYIKALVAHCCSDDSFEWVLFCTDAVQAEELMTPLDRDHSVRWVHAPITHYTIGEQLHFWRILENTKLDLLHVPHFNVPLLYRGAVIITIHDLLWHQQKGMSVTTLHWATYWAKYLAYRAVVRGALKKAQRIIVPSAVVKDTIGLRYPSERHKLQVIYEGVSDTLLRWKDKKTIPDPNSLLYVGSLYPHKNVPIILEALGHNPDMTLDVVTSRNAFVSAFRTAVTEKKLGSRVRYHFQVSDATLSALYQHSWALIQPSTSEGFGLTGLEALSLGTPVVASDIPIFREVYQDACVYFDPHSPESLSAALQSITDTKRLQLQHAAAQVAQQYSWQTMGTETLALYHRQLASE